MASAAPLLTGLARRCGTFGASSVAASSPANAECPVAKHTVTLWTYKPYLNTAVRWSEFKTRTHTGQAEEASPSRATVAGRRLQGLPFPKQEKVHNSTMFARQLMRQAPRAVCVFSSSFRYLRGLYGLAGVGLACGSHRPCFLCRIVPCLARHRGSSGARQGKLLLCALWWTGRRAYL